jgi:hypothetical protein
MLQPYLERVDEAGETALMYFAIEPHTQGPLLRSEAIVDGLLRPSRSLHADRAKTKSTDRGLRGNTVCSAALRPHRHDPECTRAPVLLELELTEPSLFFTYAAGSAERLARALLTRVEQISLP